MAFEDVMAEIERLLGEMHSRPADRHELYFELRGKLSELRAMGTPVPDDLARFESELEAEFAADLKAPRPPAHPR